MPAKGAHVDVIVGGGVVGLSIAWRLAREGRAVTVVDPAPGRGASYAAAGMLAPVSEVSYTERPLLRLGVASLRRWPSFAAELAADAGITDSSETGPGSSDAVGFRAGGNLSETLDFRGGGKLSEALGFPGSGKPSETLDFRGSGKASEARPRLGFRGGDKASEAALGLGFGAGGEASEAVRLGLDLRADGTLDVAFNADDLATLDELAAFMEKLGLPVERLTGRECRRLEPMLAPSVRGGLLAPGDAWVDPRRVTAALLAALDRLGVPLIRARASELLRDGVKVTGVRLEPPPVRRPGDSPNGGYPGGGVPGGRGSGGGPSGGPGGGGLSGEVPEEVLGEWVVLAAGAWSGELADVPVRPVKGQIMRLRSPQPLLGRCVRGIVHGSPVYLVPRGDGELVLGATQEELGFDTRVTAGGLYELLRDARELVPGVTELEVADVVAGLRPGTPDNLPLIGPGGEPGLVLATGHHRGGVLLSPLTADMVTTLVTGSVPGDEGELAALCSPMRFRDIS
jgi:glycine oxidase